MTDTPSNLRYRSPELQAEIDAAKQAAQPKHTPTPYRQGTTLMTRKVMNMGKDWIESNETRERLMVFSSFRDIDKGRSRQLVAQCQNEKDAAFIVRACNSHDALVKALEDLLQNLEEGDFISTTRIDNAKVALAKAKGGQQ